MYKYLQHISNHHNIKYLVEYKRVIIKSNQTFSEWFWIFLLVLRWIILNFFSNLINDIICVEWTLGISNKTLGIDRLSLRILKAYKNL